MKRNYEVLNVPVNASKEKIQEACMALAMKNRLGNDRNSPDSREERLKLAEAWRILTDPELRRTYDTKLGVYGNQPSAPRPPQDAVRKVLSTHLYELEKKPRASLSDIILAALRWNYRVRFLVVATIVVSLFVHCTDSRNGESRQYTRPPLTPFGHEWPVQASYLEGAPVLETGGRSSILIGNSGNKHSVHVKLCSLFYSSRKAVRECYIPGGAAFTFRDVTAGTYEVRFQNLETGEVAKTKTFEVTENSHLSGSGYSVITITLYKVRDGNFHTERIASSDF
jgi:hypothetical protein